MSRCTGHCCKRFFLPVSPERMEEEKESIAAGNASVWQDGETIVDMVIFLEKDSYRENSYWYTCRHFDTVSGNCKNYENRPRMCSQYPYGGGCRYEGCTMRNNCEIEYKKELV